MTLLLRCPCAISARSHFYMEKQNANCEFREKSLLKIRKEKKQIQDPLCVFSGSNLRYSS
jgi:hypothetical protein